MIYNWKYKTPKEYSNIIMNSDGESLIGLFFEDSKDSSKHEVNCVNRCQYGRSFLTTILF